MGDYSWLTSVLLRPVQTGTSPEQATEWESNRSPDPSNADNTFVNNYLWWADYRDDLDAKFQSWLAQ